MARVSKTPASHGRGRRNGEVGTNIEADYRGHRPRRTGVRRGLTDNRPMPAAHALKLLAIETSTDILSVAVGGPAPLASHTGPGAARHRGVAQVAAPVVEHAHHGVVGNAACFGIVGVDLQHGAALDVAQALHVHEGGVQEVARGRRDHGQRVSRIRSCGFVVGQVVGQAVVPARSQARAVKLALAARCWKAAIGKWCIGNGQGRVALAQ